jgi:hypothetical protein
MKLLGKARCSVEELRDKNERGTFADEIWQTIFEVLKLWGHLFSSLMLLVEVLVETWASKHRLLSILLPMISRFIQTTVKVLSKSLLVHSQIVQLILQL